MSNNTPTNIERLSDLIDLDVESGETVEIETPNPTDTEVDVEFAADGSAEVNYFPDEETMAETPFDANLAEFVDEGELGALSSQLMGDFEEDQSSREEWEDTYIRGLDLLGFKYEDRDRPFPGASGVTHPMMAEAVTQFQAQAFKELLPSKGPVKTQIMGATTPEVEMQSSRVQEFMNYQITTEMEEYTPEMDQLLFYLPLAGSAFKKVYYDTMKQRACSLFVPVEDLLVPYSASDINTCERVTHIVKMTHNEVRAQQLSGAYLDIEIKPSEMSVTDVEDKTDELEGIENTSDMMYELLEFHVSLDLPGFEDPDGMHIPYIITVDKTSSKILSIRRNYREDDPLKQKIQYFVHYKFLPGLGFYGFGLIHMIGGLSRTATAALRQLIDAGTLSNLPAGFKARGLRIRDDETPLEPGEFRDVDAPGGALKDSLVPLPYKEPSQTLLALMGTCVDAGQRFASTTNLQVGEGNQELPVGTTMALLEQGTRVMSAVHKRLHYAQKTEFKILARLFSETLPAEYPYQIIGGDQSIKQTDFDGRIDIIPVSDPNFFSMSQRISLAQQELQLVQSNPEIHNIKEAYRRMYEALGTENVDTLFLPDPPPPVPTDPALENAGMLMGMPATAFPEQDHATHIEIHLAFVENKYVQANPATVSMIVSHVLQHVSLLAQGQAEQELQLQLQQNPELAMQMQQQEMMNQQAAAQGQPPMPNPMLENMKAQTQLELMQQLMPRLDEILNTGEGDAITQLKAQELQIRAQENADDKEIAEKRLDLDEEKLKSQEDIAAMKIQAEQQRNNNRGG